MEIFQPAFVRHQWYDDRFPQCALDFLVRYFWFFGKCLNNVVKVYNRLLISICKIGTVRYSTHALIDTHTP